MKHKSLYLILCTLLCCVSCGKSSSKRVSVPTDPNAKVWVCTGESSERYHASSLDEEVVVKAVENLQKEINGLNIVYFHNGYFKEDAPIYEELKSKSPKLILVALGSPRQEEFIYNAKKVLNPALMVGIGGSLDVWSGSVKRAPKIFQKLGLEWLYRTISQPSRFKRIFPTLPLFLLKVINYKDKI